MSGKDLKSICGSKCHLGMNVETQAFWDNLSPWAEGPTVRSLTQMSEGLGQRVRERSNHDRERSVRSPGDNSRQQN